METGGLEVMLLTTTMSPVYCSITHDLPYFDLLVIFYIVMLCMMKHHTVQCEKGL